MFVERLFASIGKTIKSVAVSLFVLETVVSVICGIIFILANEDASLRYIGPLMIFLGPCIAWLSVLTLYGFGELIDRVCVANDQLEKLIYLQSMTVSADDVSAEPEQQTQNINARPDMAPGDFIVELQFALGFETDDAMIRFLQTIPDSRIIKILEGPKYSVRKQIEILLDELAEE